jgi:allophanate hydrolase
MFRKAASILYDGAYVAERWEDLKGFVEGHPGKTFPVTETILRSGNKEENTAAKLFGNLHELQFYRHKTEELLRGAVMVMPTAGGTFTRDEVRENPIETNSLMGLYTNHCNLLDLAAVAVPENSRDTHYPFGITIFGLHEEGQLVCKMAEEFVKTESVEFAVCGLHKKGYALESQLTSLGAKFLRHDKTADCYKLYRLSTTPVKPGMVKVTENGGSIAVDVYVIEKEALGRFLEDVQAPLTIGSVELEDGRIVKGFLCEERATIDAEDITENGGF